MDEGHCSFERLGKHTHDVICVSVFMGSDGEHRIVSGSCDDTLKVWNTESGLCERTLQGHTNSVMCVSVFKGSDGTNRIVSGSYDKTLKVWNAESGLCERTLQGHTKSVICVSMFMGSDGFPRFVIGSGKSVKMLNCKYLTLIADLRRKVKELEEIIEELKSLPGGYYYLEAKKDFEERRGIKRKDFDSLE